MLLEVKHADFYYDKGQPILKDVCFELNTGEILAVMGRNGIGKTTLIKCIAGILPWTGGSSSLNGLTSSNPAMIRQIGYVPQAHKSSFSYTVLDMVVFGLTGHQSYFAAPRKKDYEQAADMLARLGMEDLMAKRCNELSGGQLQMVFIARALINHPQLLILDEPESHLDFRNQLRLLKLLKTVASEEHIACIINTHYPDHALRIADTCFLLGEHDYQVGAVSAIMTEANIEKYFSVQAQTLHTRYQGQEISSFVFLDEVYG